jgi:peptidoglycan hydrolase CwlO-like protein
MDEGFGKLQANVGHVQSDVAEIRTEARTTNAKIDDVRKEVTAIASDVRSEFGEKLDAAWDHSERIRVEVTEKLGAVSDTMYKSLRDTGTHIEMVRVELTGKIDDVRNRIEMLRGEMFEKFERIDLRIQLTQAELTKQIDQVKDSVYRLKVEALIAATGGLIYLVAHTFKWV